MHIVALKINAALVTSTIGLDVGVAQSRPTCVDGISSLVIESRIDACRWSGETGAKNDGTLRVSIRAFAFQKTQFTLFQPNY